MRVVAAALFAVVGLAAGAFAQSVSLEVVALAPDQRAPSTPAAVHYTGLSSPQVSPGGQALYGANFQGPGFSGDGIYSFRDAHSTLVVRSDTAAPGTSGPARFVDPLWQTPLATGDDQVAFTSHLTGNDVTPDNDLGLWWGKAGGLELVARTGGPLPGLPAGAVPVGLDLVGSNDDGQFLFHAPLEGPGVGSTNDSAYWRATGTNVEPLVRTGQPAPDLGPGVTFRLLASQDFAFNEQGQAAFVGRVMGPGITATFDDRGIWVGEPGNLQLVARSREQAPGAPPGVFFQMGFLESLSAPSLSPAGELAFRSSLVGAGVAVENPSAIFQGTPGNLQMIARLGDAAPGLPAGVHFADFESAWGPLAIAGGQTLFESQVLGPGVTIDSMRALWLGSPSGIELVLRTGDPIEGMPDGRWGNAISPSVNALGQIAMFSDVVFPNDTRAGLFVRDVDGAWTKIAMVGDTVEVAPGDLRVLKELWPPGQFNERGDLVFEAHFTDFSEAVLLAHVPEPPAWALLAIGAAGLASISRRATRSRGSCERNRGGAGYSPQ